MASITFKICGEWILILMLCLHSKYRSSVVLENVYFQIISFTTRKNMKFNSFDVIWLSISSLEISNMLFVTTISMKTVK